MRTLDNWGDEAINLMVDNPIFSVLRTAHVNALMLFSDGTHGVFLCANIDAAYARMGTRKSDLRALPARAAKRRDYFDASSSEKDVIFWNDLTNVNPDAAPPRLPTPSTNPLRLP